MYVNGVDAAPILNETEYSDNWIRTFKNNEIPKFREYETILLQSYIKYGKIEEILIYLEHYRHITGEMAEFLVRELYRGNINAE